ncbi:hypothetical protein CFC21_018347 [Triticum aestivum]|uniref:Uncharacterized protein n=2 Tax=Triticum aestivum TaxID=4565 RepID=A0A3B6B3L6_WHEAT|nr:hypothetical protein CFC21_018347 [Triticum aestivum]
MACGGEAGPGVRREGAVAGAATGGEVLGGDKEKREEKRTGEELLRRDCSGDQSARSCRCEERSWRDRGRAMVRGEVDDFGLARWRQSRGGGGAEGMRSMAAPWPASAHGARVWFERCKEARDP